MSSYRLDKTAFKAQTTNKASNHAVYYKTLTWQERLRIANYLNSVAYNYPENEPPKWINLFLALGARPIITNAITMGLIDFFVFYETTLYKSKEEENRTGNQRLGKATRVAGSIVATWNIIVIQLLCFLIFKPKTISGNIWLLIIFVTTFTTMLIMRNIYITKVRYKYVISEEYPAFRLSSNVGMFIVFITLLASIAIAGYIGMLLGNL